MEEQQLQQKKKELSKPNTNQYNIVTDKDILKQKSEVIDDAAKIKEIDSKLRDIILNGPDAIGLAAVQIGIHKRIFVITTGLSAHKNDKKEDHLLTVINPEIKKIYDKYELFKEGCLSEPGIAAIMKRSRRIKVKFTTIEGRTITTTFSGLDAVEFQHEYDHLEGLLMTDNAVKVFDENIAAE